MLSSCKSSTVHMMSLTVTPVVPTASWPLTTKPTAEVSHTSDRELSKAHDLPDDLLLEACRGREEEKQAAVAVRIDRCQLRDERPAPRHFASDKRVAADNLDLFLVAQSMLKNRRRRRSLRGHVVAWRMNRAAIRWCVWPAAGTGHVIHSVYSLPFSCASGYCNRVLMLSNRPSTIQVVAG